ADELWGGSGNDTFRYAAAANESNTANGIDTVHDFHHGFDKIDVSAIDASASPGTSRSCGAESSPPPTAFGSRRLVE
ncbi:MAG TPA: M10 family metallopeptidase C-terminal domain-containing protein, partial [Beijerinckiaceae bacterium]|nr:M10 family metallopeptidase C-terminal domain-containing protein [Beijerinckiaceae bacterium]